MKKKPQLKLAVWKFSSCDGCQLSILNCEEELLALADHLDIRYFLEASSRVRPGPYDISLVEGSISTKADLERIQEVRRSSKFVVAIGACANTGGIQALKNFAALPEFVSAVYAKPEYISTLSTSTGIADHIKVDFELRGCPINKAQLLEVLGAFVQGRRPQISAQSVCVECKLKAHVCVMVSQGMACAGPITHAGCGALCPQYHRGCFSCYGAQENPNFAAMTKALQLQGATSQDLLHLYRGIYAGDAQYTREANKHDPHD